MSQEVLLDNSVLILLFSQTLLMILNTIAFAGSITIVRRWDFSATSTAQYVLEKRSYLVMLIITVSLFFNILLLPYFAYTIQQLSTIVPGAMCGAGVISANAYGNPLLLLKIFILLFVGSWLIINQEDIKAKQYPYLVKKFWFFILIYGVMLAAYILEWLYFSHISLQKPVACCSVIFGLSGDNPLPLGLDISLLLTLFYLLALLQYLFIWQKRPFALAAAAIPFLWIAYEAVIHFFGTYIYQLPTHICPFCMLQKEYYYIGYLLWGLLFLSLFFGIVNALLKLFIQESFPRFYRYAFWSLSTFIMITAGYVIAYRLQNGVWL